MYQNTGSFACEVLDAGEDGDILSNHPDKMLARLTDTNHVQCPLKRGLFQAIREKRRGLGKEYANQVAMIAARKFIEMHDEQ